MREGFRMNVAIQRVGPVTAKLPAYQTVGSAGMDLHAALEAPVTLRPGERRAIPTGIAIALPLGYEAQVRPRSGLARDFGITVLNAPGTVDSDYRGEISVVLINHGEKDVSIEPETRIAQLVVAKVERVEWDLVTELSATSRGSGGYGSTGR
jgi:dUTP pyrophosphatase